MILSRPRLWLSGYIQAKRRTDAWVPEAAGDGITDVGPFFGGVEKAGGGCVRLKAGTYLAGSTLPPNVHIRGTIAEAHE